MDNGGTVETTYLGAIREALQEEMRADESVFMLGEDIVSWKSSAPIESSTPRSARRRSSVRRSAPPTWA